MKYKNKKGYEYDEVSKFQKGRTKIRSQVNSKKYKHIIPESIVKYKRK